MVSWKPSKKVSKEREDLLSGDSSGICSKVTVMNLFKEMTGNTLFLK